MNSLLLQLMEFQTAWISVLFLVLVALVFLVMLILQEVALDLLMKKNPFILIQWKVALMYLLLLPKQTKKLWLRH